jgi:hypothetical protein
MGLFTVNANKMADSLKKLDDALLKNRREREDALKEMGNKLKNIVEALNNRTSDYLSDLSTLISGFANADADKIKLIMDYIKSGGGASSSSAVRDTNKAIEGMDKIEVKGNNKNDNPSLSAEQLTSALSSALDSMRMRRIYNDDRKDYSEMFIFETDNI